MNDFSTRCFVCQKTIDPQGSKHNKELNLPVCDLCEESDQEREAIQKLTDELADGFVCGCI
ncbi:hypothetical protein [Sunxiuqinia sp. sy24]|uniref:hypothetical protein n=1 Tax=Sunxiuqinia sp. sy24 TaxID=3461495 RepID=UPI004045E8B8